eukprot:scaffold171372_cov30-Tisochrysis_lutea.AAC.3
MERGLGGSGSAFRPPPHHHRPRAPRAAQPSAHSPPTARPPPHSTAAGGRVCLRSARVTQKRCCNHELDQVRHQAVRHAARHGTWCARHSHPCPRAAWLLRCEREQQRPSCGRCPHTDAIEMSMEGLDKFGTEKEVAQFVRKAFVDKVR